MAGGGGGAGFTPMYAWLGNPPLLLKVQSGSEVVHYTTCTYGAICMSSQFDKTLSDDMNLCVAHDDLILFLNFDLVRST